jgi:hypothetical protein
LLEPEQHKAISEIAQERGESISSLVREIIEEYLVERDQDEQRRREIEAVHYLAQIRGRIEAEHGLVRADLLAEARDERAADLDTRGSEE